MPVSTKRRWFQFSLKGMLVVITLACVALAWLAYERNEVRKHQADIAAIVAIAEVDFDKETPFRPPWLRTLLGDTSAGEVVMVNVSMTGVTDGGLVHLQGLTELKRLCLSATQVTDTGLVHLKGLTKLESLRLDVTQVTDAGLVHLKGLKELKVLDLNRTQVTDIGLGHLKGLTELKELDLDGTEVTDAGLVHLKGLTKLERLSLNGTQVTVEGICNLKKALPNTDCGLRYLP